MNNQAHNYVSGFSRSTMNHQYWPHKTWPHTTWLFCTLFTFLLVSCGGQQKSNSDGNSNGGALTQLPKLIRKDEVSGQWVVASRKNAEMVLVPAGTFLMGTSKNMSDRIASGYSMNFWDEMPQHKVTVRDFYIDRHEVTNEAYNKYLKEQGGTSPRFWRDPKFNHPRQPIVGISWDDATDYARWLGKRLPTEAEWEKAACWDWERAEELNIPTDAALWDEAILRDAVKCVQIYPWGNAVLENRLNFKRTNDRPTIVGLYGPGPNDGSSPYEAYDMAGNASEWVADLYDVGYYSKAPVNNPTKTSAGSRFTPDGRVTYTGGVEHRVHRGGMWNEWRMKELDVRSARRLHAPPETRSPGIGFRCAIDVDQVRTDLGL